MSNALLLWRVHGAFQVSLVFVHNNTWSVISTLTGGANPTTDVWWGITTRRTKRKGKAVVPTALRGGGCKKANLDGAWRWSSWHIKQTAWWAYREKIFMQQVAANISINKSKVGDADVSYIFFFLPQPNPTDRTRRPLEHLKGQVCTPCKDWLLECSLHGCPTGVLRTMRGCTLIYRS